MKQIFKYILIIGLGVIVFTSCKEDPITISEKIVGFDGMSATISETSGTPIAIPIFSGSASGNGTTVTFTFSTEGINNPAIEGEDFTLVNSTNTITFDKYYGTDTIFIQPIDNDIYDKDKKVKIVLGTPTNGYELTNTSVYTLTISDNEHPLALIIGTYTEKDYLYSDGTLEATYTDAITIGPHPDDETKVIINNFWDGGGYDIEADVDLSTNSMVILPGQIIYVSGTYGDCKMVRIAGGAYDNANGINCTIDANGNIETESWAALVSAGAFGNYERSVLTKSVK